MKSFLIVISFLLAGSISFSQTGQVIICNGKYSERYHAKMCSGLSNCQGGTQKVSIDEAKEKKRTPCITCYGVPKSSIPQGNFSGQCRATTKKGTRCSRSARSGGYCWQHE